MKDLTKSFSEIFARVNKGEGSIGKLVYDDELYNSAVSVTQSADKSLTIITKRLDEISGIIINTTGSVKSILEEVDVTIADVHKIVNKVNKGEGTIGALISDTKMSDSIKTIVNNLTRTSDQANIAVSRLAESMEALKHNWLFKGYFEKRGYWDGAQYEKDLDIKLDELKKQNELLDTRTKELKALEIKMNKN